MPKTLYYCGEILNMLLVFDPVSDDLTKTTSSDSRSLRSPSPRVGLPAEFDDFDSTKALQMRSEALSKINSNVKKSKSPMVGHLHEDPPSFYNVTGLGSIGTVDGIVAMIVGFIDGTGLVTEPELVIQCEEVVRWDMVYNGWLLGNSSAGGHHWTATYAFWDIIYNIHPMFMDCRGWMYNLGRNIVYKFDDLEDIRRIIVNLVNHIDEMTDSVLDMTDFFGLTDKGRMVDTPYRVGRAAGSLIYLTITKDNSDPMYDPANDLEMEMMPW